MKVIWSDRSKSDLSRLFDYLATADENAATEVIQSLVAAGRHLGTYPRLGRRMPRFNPREVRSVVVGSYELLYKISDETVQIARVYHVRQDRPFYAN